MSKQMRLFMLGMLCSGLLLTGAGVGIGFVEYSGFTYAGERMLGAAQQETAVFTVALEYPEKPVRISSYARDIAPLLQEAAVQPNEDVPLGSVRFTMTYEAVGSEPHFWRESSDGSEAEEQIRLGWTTKSDLAVLLMGKDAVLEDLKNHQIGDYRLFRPIALSITAHPDTAAQIIVG